MMFDSDWVNLRNDEIENIFCLDGNNKIDSKTISKISMGKNILDSLRENDEDWVKFNKKHRNEFLEFLR